MLKRLFRFLSEHLHFVPAISNVSTAYNLVIINFVLILLSDLYPSRVTVRAESTVSSASLAGAIVGQLIFGAIGDILGRRKGMILTLSTTLFGALGTFALPQDNGDMVNILAAFRFILGLGVGGVYPLSATAVAEATTDNAARGMSVALTFSFQGWGQLLAPLMAFFLTYGGVPHKHAWRILLALGIIPAIVPLWVAVRDRSHSRHPASARDEDKAVAPPPSKMKTVWLAVKEGSYARALLGCAGGWFLFDVTFYGNLLFAPAVLDAVFEFDEDNVHKQAAYTALLAAIALPGYYLSVAFADVLGRRNLQMLGFAIMALLFVILGSLFNELVRSAPGLLLVLYGLTFTASNFGPNTTTFILPSETFPFEIRAAMNGFCAASGKLGATVGAAAFKPLLSSQGEDVVLLLCGAVSLLGLAVTYYCVEDRRGRAMASLAEGAGADMSVQMLQMQRVPPDSPPDDTGGDEEEERVMV